MKRARAAVFLGLGSNVGDREGQLARGLRLLEGRGFRLLASSSLYETEPVGGPPQAWYLNVVAKGESEGSPEDLLAECLAVEHEMGRVREVALGPRTLDVDLLLFGDEVRATAALTLPHPRLHERRFVLVPLAEVDPGARHPLLGSTAAELLERCADTSRVLPHQPQGARAR